MRTALGITEEAYSSAMKEAEAVAAFAKLQIKDRNFWQVSESELKFIYSITRGIAPNRVVETGVGPGTTSYALLSALAHNGGRLFSFDLGQKYGEEKIPEPVGFVVPSELRNNWVLTLGNSRKTLPEKLSEIGRIGIFFHDSEHTYDHVTFELSTIYPSLEQKFLILIDNYDWTDAPADFANEKGLELTKIADDLCALYRG